MRIPHCNHSKYTHAYIFINWQVEKVEPVFELYRKLFQQTLLGVLVRDVLHHHSRSPILLDLIEINPKISALLVRGGSLIAGRK